jgi:ribitol 2-dehydrogenase
MPPSTGCIWYSTQNINIGLKVSFLCSILQRGRLRLAYSRRLLDTGAMAELTLPLHGRVFLVTGASSGIGRATGLMLAAAGANVILFARSAERLEQTKSRCSGRALVTSGDVTDPLSLRSAVQRGVGHFGRLDGLFANAGLYLSGDVSGGNSKAWSELIDVNIKGVLYSVEAVLEVMQQQKSGDIIVCSSISGHQAIPWEPIYSASKHAVQSFVHGLRRQMLGSGIRVGAVAPGMVLNELWGITDSEEIDRRTALGEGLRSEDVAEAVLFMLTRPRNVTIRDLVMLPRTQDL